MINRHNLKLDIIDFYTAFIKERFGANYISFSTDGVTHKYSPKVFRFTMKHEYKHGIHICFDMFFHDEEGVAFHVTMSNDDLCESESTRYKLGTNEEFLAKAIELVTDLYIKFSRRFNDRVRIYKQCTCLPA
jgi:hypothetical protein